MNAVDFQDPFSAPHLRQKLLKEDKNIRSSLIVSEVVGGLSSANISRIVQNTCGAGLFEVDASSESANGCRLPRNFDLLGISIAEFCSPTAGSFEMPKDSKVLVINLNFPPLPTTNFRAAKLIEHGMIQKKQKKKSLNTRR